MAAFEDPAGTARRAVPGAVVEMEDPVGAAPASTRAPHLAGNEVFADLLEANRRYRAERHDPDVDSAPKKALAVLTCIDARIDPLAVLGLEVGDAKIIRNAGGRVTDDALRSIVVASNLLGVTRVIVVQHSDCAMTRHTEEELRGRIAALRGADTDGWRFLAGVDQSAMLHDDVALITSCPLVPPDLHVGGFLFDVRTGALLEVVGSAR